MDIYLKGPIKLNLRDLSVAKKETSHRLIWLNKSIYTLLTGI